MADLLPNTRVTLPPSPPWTPTRMPGTVTDVRRHSVTGEVLCVFVAADHWRGAGGREVFSYPYLAEVLEVIPDG